MKSYKFIVSTILILSVNSYALAHGENKPGPHKGYIRMPGTFHTEVVPEGDAKFQIYLLDIKWKNPTIQNSTLEVKLVDKDKTASAQCNQKTDHFVCTLPKGFTLKQGKLLVSAVRENSRGIEMPYDLPLSFNPTTNEDPHKGHH